MWKPYLILKTLNEMPENDILIYMDAGNTITRPIDSLVENLSTKDTILFDINFSNKQFTRKMLFQMMDIDNETVWNTKHMQATILLVKNTKATRDFINEWLSWAEKPEAITDEPKMDEYPEFIDHRHDQSILSLLSIKHKNDVSILAGIVITKYFFTHRRNGYDESSLVFPNVELSPLEFGLSKAAYRSLNN